MANEQEAETEWRFDTQCVRSPKCYALPQNEIGIEREVEKW